MKLHDIAARLECRLEGDPDIDIRGVAGIDDAGPGDLTFFTNPKYAASLRTTRASAVILGETRRSGARARCCAARHPYLAFARAVELFADPWRPPPGVHATAAIGQDVTLGDGVSVGPFAVIGDGARIGARSVVARARRHRPAGRDRRRLRAPRPRVYPRAHSHSGNRVILQDGAVIGSDGFGFARRPDGTHHKIPQVGGVVIEDDVEIGANAAVDRPAVGETRIGAGTKIDNLVQIAHGVTHRPQRAARGPGRRGGQCDD